MVNKYPANIKCGDCGRLWDDCICEHHLQRLKEGLKANGYVLDKSDNEEKL